MRVIMCGSREWNDVEPIRLVVGGLAEMTVRQTAFSNTDRRLTIVHGAGRGADTIIDGEARRLGINTERHPADWDRYGKRAGPTRNFEMAALGADLCIGFLLYSADCDGTKDMLGNATAQKIPTLEVWQ